MRTTPIYFAIQIFIIVIISQSSLSQKRPQTTGLRQIYQWSQMDFNFPSEAIRQQAIANGTFVPVNASAPASMEMSGSRVFIALPRWKAGVPATLNTIPFPSDTQSPKLTPYPSLEFNREGNCNGLTSVYRVKADECNRLWVLDTGTINAFTDAQNICPFKVVAFDLSNDEVIHSYNLSTTVVRENSQLVTIEVEYPNGECGAPTDAFIYIADTNGFALIVVNLSSGRSWRIQDKSMYPTPNAGTYNVAGETFELMDGVLGLALSPPGLPEDRLLYFYSMSSFNQRRVPTRILRDEERATSSPGAFEVAEATRSSQGGDCAIDNNGVLFFGLLGEQSVACWNTNMPYTAQNIAVLMRDDRRMHFPVSVQVDSNSRLWVFATGFQKFFLGTMPATGMNFHIFMAPSTTALIQGTACQGKTTRNRLTTDFQSKGQRTGGRYYKSINSNGSTGK